MILCCGEALIDMLPRQTAEGEPSFAPHAGGAVFNTAIALGRLGAPAGFFSGLSTDFLGRQLDRALADAGVDTRHCVRSDRPTTLAFVQLTDGHASYTFYDEGTAGRMISTDDLPDLGDEVSALLFGAISLIPEPCGSAYEALMAGERGRRVVMFDPNIRPGFIPDRDRHLARMRRMLAMSDIVKLSEEDLAWFGEPGDTCAVARGWLERGPKLVVVTCGSDGLVAFNRDHMVSVPARRVSVVDTVGAGDTVNAGILAALHEAGRLTRPGIAQLGEAELIAVLEFAAAAASVTVGRAGANPPWRHELP
ncbi:carbohydrate kinase [Aquibium sp. ELW1220]|uniref:carbohydrate kinase family protein n=1 Tax=Aquibium sp. ELW1220 TaxID=2976766 RepID=UPI0025B1A6D9|nr:carbohydrate kinase [Aquibium sp. ELW1220]MDN2582183.1 carbohydrate kinase [Aquibium sp. ELW1220]